VEGADLGGGLDGAAHEDLPAGGYRVSPAAVVGDFGHPTPTDRG
jgi:hypothetical protein